MTTTATVASARGDDRFTLEEFFAGHTTADAQFRAINGIHRKFRIDINGRWKDNSLFLHESFQFDDGEAYEKNWEFKKLSEGRYLANREDIVRPATATISGNTLRYNYLLYLDPANHADIVRFRDRITRLDNRTLRNTAVVFKFGIPVAMVTGVFWREA